MDRRLFLTHLTVFAVIPRFFAKTAFALDEQKSNDTQKTESCFFARTADIDTCSHTLAPESMVSDNENI